ncbi:MAG TPA: hypothetical protein VHC49_11150 [Mycobacteriales bacterium]|nr:hypothetical protein [Mycobacteriales bacterium]
MNTHKYGRVAAVGAAVAALSVGGVLTAGPASASGGVCTVGDHCSGNVTFQSKGEIFTIHDYNKDGHGVYGVLEYKGKAGYWNTKVAATNNKGYDASPLVKNVSIPENRTVRYYVCLSDGDWVFDCSDWYYDHS